MPDSMFMSVVFPLPFSPSTERISPFRTSRLTFSLATTLPKRFVTPRISTAIAFSTGHPPFRLFVLYKRKGAGGPDG